MSHTNEKNSKERPHAEVAVSDFFSEKGILKHILAILFFSVAFLIVVAIAIDTTIGSDNHFEKLKRYLASQRKTLPFSFFIAKINPIFSRRPLCLTCVDFENIPWHFGTTDGVVENAKVSKMPRIKIENKE